MKIIRRMGISTERRKKSIYICKAISSSVKIFTLATTNSSLRNPNILPSVQNITHCLFRISISIEMASEFKNVIKLSENKIYILRAFC